MQVLESGRDDWTSGARISVLPVCPWSRVWNGRWELGPFRNQHNPSECLRWSYTPPVLFGPRTDTLQSRTREMDFRDHRRELFHLWSDGQDPPSPWECHFPSS